MSAPDNLGTSQKEEAKFKRTFMYIACKYSKESQHERLEMSVVNLLGPLSSVLTYIFLCVALSSFLRFFSLSVSPLLF